MKRLNILAFALAALFLIGTSHPVYASRFSLFALDIQVPVEAGQSTGEARKIAIDKGLQEAVEEATYRIIPDQGLEATYQTLKTHIFDKARQFVPQYKIMGEKEFPGTFDLSLQVTVDMVLLRQALMKLGLLKPIAKGAGKPVTLEIQDLTSGKVLMEIMSFFDQRPDLAADFKLESARHGDFTFTFIPLQSLREIASQILYHARISRGTLQVVRQEKDHLVLRYRLESPS